MTDYISEIEIQDEIEIQTLADAMWQLLDDMGADGKSVCLHAKAEARVAMEPFLNVDRPACDNWMPLQDAIDLVHRRKCNVYKRRSRL